MRRDGADRRVAIVPAKERHGRQQLPQQRDDDGDVDRNVGGRGFLEHLRQPPALRQIGDELQSIGRRPIEPAHVNVRGVTDGGKARDALAERANEAAVFDEFRREFEQLDFVAGFGVDATCSAAKPVGDRRRGCGSWEHSIHVVQRPFQKCTAVPPIC